MRVSPKRAVLWSLVVVAVVATGASYYALADGNSNVQVIVDPPAGGECDCPQVWAPVACRNASGDIKRFGNTCLAGCYGYTQHCAPINVP